MLCDGTVQPVSFHFMGSVPQLLLLLSITLISWNKLLRFISPSPPSLTQEHLVRTKLPPNPSAVFQSGSRVFNIWQLLRLFNTSPARFWCKGISGGSVSSPQRKNLCKGMLLLWTLLSSCLLSQVKREKLLLFILLQAPCSYKWRCMWQNSLETNFFSFLFWL